MKLTEKMKKNLAILGGVLIGIGLIAAIGMQFGSKPSGKDVLPGTGETETELIVDPGDFEKKEEESKVVSREEESLVIHQGIGENQETDTIGASELNFSVRNGKRWDLTAITT